MAGFPGESDREFEETLEFVRALPFGYLHLFPFSPRPGTRGWALHSQSPVPAKVVEERMAVLRTLAVEKTAAHRQQFVGRELDAITLHTPLADQALGRTAALTENFLPVDLDALLPANQQITVRVAGISAEQTLQGTIVNSISNPIRASGRPDLVEKRF
jgi:threonylcarbamoyladenosine tRNA methylthiotransferase MtaB